MSKHSLLSVAVQGEQLRNAQKLYFQLISKAKKTRNPEEFETANKILATSKNLEAVFDGTLKEIYADQGKDFPVQYVLGFAFSRDGNDIVLIEKNHPDWQKGKLNGIGGKIEPEDMSPLAAMIREFKEETGVDTSGRDGDMINGWQHFSTMTFNDDVMGGKAVVYCFKMFSNVIYQCRTVESERIHFFASDTALSQYSLPLIDNLPILIRTAKHPSISYTEIVY